MSQRKAVFLLGCIGSRSVLTYLSSNMNLLPYTGGLYLLFSIGIFYIYIFGSKKADSQLEWLGDKKIWWNKMRLIHGIIWLLFAILAFNKYNYSWIVLAVDTLIGLSVWILHTYYEINYN